MEMTVEQRVERLEGRVSRYRFALVLLAAALCAIVSVAATGNGGASDVLRTRELQIVNLQDSVVVTLGSYSGGDGVAILRNSAGTAVSAIAATGDGGRLDIYNRFGTRVSGIGAAADGGWLGILSNAGELVTGMSATPHGGLVQVSNSDGAPVSAMLAAEFGGQLEVSMNDGTPASRVAAAESGGELAMHNSAGYQVSAFQTAEHGGQMSIHNNAGERVATIDAIDRGGALAIRNRTGETVVQASIDERGRGFVGAFDRNGKGRTLKPKWDGAQRVGAGAESRGNAEAALEPGGILVGVSNQVVPLAPIENVVAMIETLEEYH